MDAWACPQVKKKGMSRLSPVFYGKLKARMFDGLLK